MEEYEKQIQEKRINFIYCCLIFIYIYGWMRLLIAVNSP